MSRAHASVAFLLSVALCSCAPNPDLPRLTVELTGAPVAEPLLVNNICVTAWFLDLPLRVRADHADVLALDSLHVRVDHAVTRGLLGQDRIDLGARPLGPDSRLDVPVHLRVDDQAMFGYQLPVVVSGELVAHLPESNARVPYRLEAVAQIVIPPPGGGACSPPP